MCLVYRNISFYNKRSNAEKRNNKKDIFKHFMGTIISGSTVNRLTVTGSITNKDGKKMK